MPVPLPTSREEAQLARVVDWARRGECDDNDIAALAEHLASSGERVTWDASAKVADVASTGGPGSLSTLLCPLALVAAGCSVVKLAVPGRPAGAIDTLGTVPGYRTRLTTVELPRVLEQSRFAHFLADERFAPLDAALFAFRRQSGAVALPVLAMASLLSKKLAVGVKHVGLDVRVGKHGNFGTTLEDARENAHRFCKVARLLGIAATAFIGAERTPAQPWIGRGESLVALGEAVGQRSGARDVEWLASHIADCVFMGVEVASQAGCLEARSGIGSAALRNALEAHMRSQGASYSSLLDRIAAVSAAPRETVTARKPGKVVVDLAPIRDVLVRLQTESETMYFEDPAGVLMHSYSGAFVTQGEPIASVRCRSGSDAQGLAIVLADAVRVIENDVAASEPSTRLGQSRVEVIRA